MKGRGHKAKGTLQKRRPKAKDRHKVANLRKPIQRKRGLSEPLEVISIAYQEVGMVADPYKIFTKDLNVGSVIRVSKELDPDGFKLSY